MINIYFDFLTGFYLMNQIQTHIVPDLTKVQSKIVYSFKIFLNFKFNIYLYLNQNSFKIFCFFLGTY